MTLPHISPDARALLRELLEWDDWVDVGSGLELVQIDLDNDERRTPVAADGRGFPDLVLVGRGKVIFAELKSETGAATAHQRDWLEQIKAAGGHAYLWRPSDWPEIEKLLTTRPPRPT